MTMQIEMHMYSTHASEAQASGANELELDREKRRELGGRHEPAPDLDHANAGRRVELVSTDDPSADLYPGDRGVYRWANYCKFLNVTQYNIDWDSGSRLMLCVPPDRFRFLDEEVT